MKNSSEQTSWLRWRIERSSAVPNKHAGRHMPSPSEALWLSVCAIAAGIGVFLWFWTGPEFDLELTRSFANSRGKFPLESNSTVLGFRWFSLYAMAAFYAGVAVCWIRAYHTQQPVLGMTWDKFAFLGTSALLGPVLLVNVLLKGMWGRGRPRDLSEFGGSYEYSEFWLISDQCTANCSFTSGEVAGVSLLIFSLAFLFGRRTRYLLLLIGLGTALCISWIRVAMGAHFASDTLMSIVLMMIVAAETYYCFYLQPAGWIDWFNAKRQEKIEHSK